MSRKRFACGSGGGEVDALAIDLVRLHFQRMAFGRGADRASPYAACLASSAKCSR